MSNSLFINNSLKGFTSLDFFESQEVNGDQQRHEEDFIYLEHVAVVAAFAAVSLTSVCKDNG